MIPDLRSVRIAAASLTNDVNNLKRRLDNAPPDFRNAKEESKMWAFVGHQGTVAGHRGTVLADRRQPSAPSFDNVTYSASSWKIGARATEIHPTTGQHTCA